MTPLQAQVLAHYRKTLIHGGYVPAQTRVAAKFGVGPARIQSILASLEQQGYLVRAARGRVELTGVVSLIGITSEELRAELARRGETLDALDGGERIKFARGGATCAADCCQLEIERGKLFCLNHWRQLPKSLRDNLLEAYFAARKSKSSDDIQWYQELVTEARDLIDCSFYGSPFAEARR